MIESDVVGEGEYFNKLRVLAENLREAVRSAPELAAEKLARKGLYVRLGRDGYRVVSIGTENPCGDPGSDSVKRVETVKKHLKKIEKHREDVNWRQKPPGNAKPEARVQAYLIYQSLVHGPEHIARMLDKEGQLVDRLWFVADEIRLESEGIRPDIIFVGGKGQKTFPVLVELKRKRDLKRVVEQLGNTDMAVGSSEGAFTDFLQSVVPEAASNFEFKALQRWIIWPAAISNAQSSVEGEAKEKGLKVIEFFDPKGEVGVEEKIKTSFGFSDEPLGFNVVHA